MKGQRTEEYELDGVSESLKQIVQVVKRGRGYGGKSSFIGILICVLSGRRSFLYFRQTTRPLVKNDTYGLTK